MNIVEPTIKKLCSSFSDRMTWHAELLAYQKSSARLRLQHSKAQAVVPLTPPRLVSKKLLGKSKSFFQVLVTLFIVWQPAYVSYAQLSTETTSAEEASPDRSQAFKAVDGVQSEERSGATSMYLAYLLIWFFLFAYLFRLGRLQAGTQKELSRLEQLLKTTEDSGQANNNKT